MKLRGQITVFLSLILLCVFGLICGLLESARMAGARYYLQTSANSALDSVMSQYHRPMWDQYRILGVEYREKEAIEKEFTYYLKKYSEALDWYPMEPDTAEIRELIHLTDSSGKYMEQQILDFMKYGIWTLDMDERAGLDLEKAMKEAEGVNQISKKLEIQTREAWKLEQTLEKLSSCLNRQENCYKRALQALQQGNGDGFLEAAEDLKNSLKQVPGLVKTYGRQADNLAEKLEEVKGEYEEKRRDMGTAVQGVMADEFLRYESYTSQDGERRQEVECLTELAEQQEKLVLETMEEAEEVMEFIENWEPEEEGDMLDEEGLWAEVETHFSGYQLLRVSYTAGGEDKETEGLLNQIRRAAESGVLSLVLPEGEKVSEGMISKGNLPSDMEETGGQRADNGNGPEGVTNLADQFLVAEYGGHFFTNFCSREKKEFQYELEYIIYGSPIDGANLSASVNRLLAVREGLNLIAILTDPQKRQEAEALAAAIVGASGFAPLIGITAFFIMGIWALGESLVDVKILLSGGKSPVWKDKDTWNLDLSGLLEMGRKGLVPQKESSRGINYTGYLKLFLTLAPVKTVIYRMMDMIQINLSREETGFSMEKCASQIEIKTEVRGKHVFLSLGLLKGLTGREAGTYRYGTIAKKGY